MRAALLLPVLLAGCGSLPPESESYLKLDYEGVRRMVETSAPNATVWMEGLNDAVPLERDDVTYLRIFRVRTSGPLGQARLRDAFERRIERYGGEATLDSEDEGGFVITYTAESKEEKYTPVRETITHELVGFVELRKEDDRTFEIVIREAHVQE